MDDIPSQISAFYLNLDIEINAIRQTVKYPLHHVTIAPAKSEVATFNGSAGDAVTRKCHHFTLSLESRSHKRSPISLYIMWYVHLQSLKLLRSTVKEGMHSQKMEWPDALTDCWTTDWLWFYDKTLYCLVGINIHSQCNQKLKKTT